MPLEPQVQPGAARGGLSAVVKSANAAANTVGALLFAALLLAFTTQITARWLFGKPLPWTDELAVALYIALIFWALATMVKPREHVVFDVLYNACPASVQRGMRVAGHAVVLGLCAWALPGVWDYVRFMQRESTPVLDWSFAWVYLPFVLFLGAVLLRSGWALVLEWQATRKPDTSA
jgi:TRAP-type C4-dicarboxylate transport system permease small subunit